MAAFLFCPMPVLIQINALVSTSSDASWGVVMEATKGRVMLVRDLARVDGGSSLKMIRGPSSI